ncbi:methyl-accepting chemotaxis protein [Tistrella mobilis]|uniref:Methyl-accepting chemotaxis protein n=1 Tax=Tistrella mobilis (strain KA081020-065) TaxID=1110502 RepID=I3TWI2_TISMK|nr:methyl-accepting chemotaxis protein [Tistrella mobilis]AFK57120.1 methyl-accepting chemotaxis protein [Tistrella mobilis KA081020-065]
MSISSLSIGKKLIIAFATLTAVILLTGVFGFSQLATLEDASYELRDNRIPSLKIVAEASNAVQNHRIAASRLVVDDNPAKRPAYLEQMSGYAEGFAAAGKVYQGLVSDEVEAAEVKLVAAAWEAYLKATEKMVAAVRSGDSVAADALYLGESRAAREAVVAELDKLRQMNVENSVTAGVRSRAAYESAITVLGVAMAVGLVIAIVATLVMIRNVSTPVRKMTEAMRRLADRDTGVDIPGADRGDEIGAMAKAVETFRDGMIHADRMAAEQERSRAEAETRRQKRETLTEGFVSRIATIVATLSGASEQVRGSADGLARTADDQSARSTTVAAAAEEASANVQTVATASEELAASIREVGARTVETADVTRAAVRQAEATDGTVQELAASARKIGDVIELIQQIAEQTNLLALNATIEAARAGEAGKGFAVVASEVKNLATQTARATEEIQAQINAMTGATGRTVEAIREISSTITRVGALTTAVASAVEQQVAATAEIARNTQQASSGTSEVLESIAGIASAAGLTGRSAEEMSGASRALAGKTRELKDVVDRYVDEVAKV